MKKITLLFLACTLFIRPVFPQAKQGTKMGDLESNLAILNLFGEQPEGIQQVYRSAYDFLVSRRTVTFAELAENEAFQQLYRENGLTHLGGPLLGDVRPDGARIWLRTLKPANITVRVTVEGVEKIYGPVAATLESDLTAIVPVDGLKPGTRYAYQVFVDGNPIAQPENAALVTAPENQKVRIAFGSCFHRWGLGNPAQSAQIRSRKPTAMLLIGDIAVQDRNHHLGLHRADYFMRDLFPAWRNLVAEIPVYATWDDHDYFDNDKAGVPPGFTRQDQAAVCDVFRQAWNNPAYGFSDERQGIFLRTRIGPCDILMLDNRYFRENRVGSFLGDAQMDWLKAQLMDCKGPFIILSCGTMWSDYVSDGKDSWGRFDPAGREEIFQLIEDRQIGGVLLISGDRHGARGFRIPRPSGFEFYEFEAASLGGREGPPVKKPEWTTQLYGFAGKYAFGEFSIDATLPDPEVTFRLIQDDGTELYQLRLKRSQLTPGKK